MSLGLAFPCAGFRAPSEAVGIRCAGGLGLAYRLEGWDLRIRKKKCCLRTLVTTHLGTLQPTITCCSPVL
jgi:hypothetical protein